MVVVGDVDLDARRGSRCAGRCRARCTAIPRMRSRSRHPERGCRRPQRPPRRRPAPPTLPRLPAEVTTRELWIGWTAPGGFGPERYVGEMWAGLVRQNLRGGRFDDDDIAGVEVFSYPSALATVFELRVALTVGDHPEKSLKEVISSMPWIGDDEIYLERRFEHLKAWTLQDLVLDAESTETRGQDRALFAHFTGSLGYMGRTVAAIQSITADQARDFATHYLAPERARAVLLEPMAGNPAATVANAGGPAVLAPAPERGSGAARDRAARADPFLARFPSHHAAERARDDHRSPPGRFGRDRRAWRPRGLGCGCARRGCGRPVCDEDVFRGVPRRFRDRCRFRKPLGPVDDLRDRRCREPGPRAGDGGLRATQLRRRMAGRQVPGHDPALHEASGGRGGRTLRVQLSGRALSRAIRRVPRRPATRSRRRRRPISPAGSSGGSIPRTGCW